MRGWVLGWLCVALVACGVGVLGCADDDDAGNVPDPDTSQSDTYPMTCDDKGYCWPEHTCLSRTRIPCQFPPAEPCPSGMRCHSSLGEICLPICQGNADCPTGQCFGERCIEPGLYADPTCPLEYFFTDGQEGPHDCASAIEDFGDYAFCSEWAE